MERKVFKGLESLAEAVETLRKSPEEQIEAKLSPEEMERMEALLEECMEKGVWDSVYSTRGLSHKRKEDQDARNEEIVKLRRQIRDERGKIVPLILQYMDGPEVNNLKVYKYSKILKYAASEENADEILEFYSKKDVAAIPDRSTKSYIHEIMGRIGSADHVEGLKKYFDITLTTNYQQYDKEYYKSLDGDLVIRALVDIRARTKNEHDIERINNAINYINGEIGQVYTPHANDPHEADIEFRSEFFHPNTSELIREFNRYFESQAIDNTRTVSNFTNLKKALAEEKAEDLLPELIQNAYWKMTERVSRGDEYFEQIAFLETITNLKPDYTSRKSEVQGMYDENFFPGDEVEDYNLMCIEKLYSITKIKFEVDPNFIKEKYIYVLANLHKYPNDYLEILESVTESKIDFNKLEPEIQQSYDRIIMNSSSYESDDYWGATGFKCAELMYEKTKIRPKIKDSQMQLCYQTWLFDGTGDVVDLITKGYELTGIEPDFSKSEAHVQNKYSRILSGVISVDSLSAAMKQIENLEKICKIKPQYNEKIIGEIYVRNLFRGSAETIMALQTLTGVDIGWTSREKEIKSKCLDVLTVYDPYDFDKVIDSVKQVQEITGLKINFTQDEMVGIISTNRRRLREYGMSPLGTLRFQEIFSDQEAINSVIENILVHAIQYADSHLFGEAIKQLKGRKVDFNIKSMSEIAIRNLHEDPGKSFTILKFLQEHSDKSELAFSIYKEISHTPWMSAFTRLEKVQAVAKNVTNDPWTKEFKPFMKFIVGERIISMENPADAELVVSFIELMGMKNLSKIFEVYADCHRNKTLDKLGAFTISVCEGCDIKTKNKDGSWRFKSSLELFNELSKILKGIQTGLLEDKVPGALTTELGEELFSRIKGSTQFERSHSLPVLLDIWNNTAEAYPEVAKLPSGFQEATFKVPALSHKIEKTADQEVELEKLMSSQEVVDSYVPLAKSIEFGATKGVYNFFTDLVAKLKEEETSLRRLLSCSREEMESMIEKEEDPKSKQNLTKKFKALQNPKGRLGIENQADILRDSVDQVVKVQDKFDEGHSQDSDYTDVLEALNQLDKKIPLTKEIRDFSALHMFDVVMQGAQRVAVTDMVDSDEGVSPSPENIYKLHKIARDYIEEHYLHHLQDSEHTNHQTFSPELLEKLTLVWQQQLDKQTGHLPITVLKNKIDKILGVYAGKTKKEISVSLVPVSGLLHIYSGDLGDSCHTHQHESMANGSYPNLRTWVYVTNRGKQNEELKGSVLSIQATEPDGSPVLIVRANNPSENFIQSVESESLVVDVLKQAVETAKRLRAERIKSNPSLPNHLLCQKVTIPMDSRGMASTNRQPVNDVYRKRFKECKKVELESTRETNFNGYDVHSLRSGTATVVIWEIDADGKETWHGNWE